MEQLQGGTTGTGETGQSTDQRGRRGNAHDSVARDKIYNEAASKFEVQFVMMDKGYKAPWIAERKLEDGKVSQIQGEKRPVQALGL